MKVAVKLLGIYLNTLSILFPKKAGKKGFELFCTPMSPAPKHYHLDFFNTAEKQTFESGEYKIQAYKWGHGKTKILFLHGWRSNTFRWKAYIEAFSKDDFTIYAMDAPAHGLSTGKQFTVPKYSQAIEKYISMIQPLDAVITHSLGGFAMLHSLYNHPDLPIKKLVLMGAPGEVSDFFVPLQEILGLSARTMKAIHKYFEETIKLPLSFFSSAKFVTNVKIPGLIIHDESDLEAPYKYSPAIHALWSNSRLIATKGLGHNLKSSDVMESVRGFVSAADNALAGRIV